MSYDTSLIPPLAVAPGPKTVGAPAHGEAAMAPWADPMNKARGQSAAFQTKPRASGPRGLASS